MASLSFEGETHGEIVQKVRRWLASQDGGEDAAERTAVLADGCSTGFAVLAGGRVAFADGEALRVVGAPGGG